MTKNALIGEMLIISLSGAHYSEPLKHYFLRHGAVREEIKRRQMYVGVIKG